MATENLKEQEQQREERVEQHVSAVSDFFEKNGKWVWGSLAAVILVGLVVLAWHHFYVQPRKAEAQAQMFPAEANFRNGEYELALKGDGNTLGFEQVIDEYGSRAGKAAYYYAGVCALNLGNYEDAISYLGKYSGKEPIMAARALGSMGDAYCGLEQYDKAVTCYENAAAKDDNVYAASYLLKAGIVSEELGNKDKALSFYKEIKDQYPQSYERTEIDKYISRIENAA